jgi:hypothetical protein
MERETIILKTLTVPQLVAKESEFYRSCMLFTMLTRANHWSLFRTRWNQSTHSHGIYCNIHQHLSLGVKSDLHPWHSLAQARILLVSCPRQKPQLSHALWFFAVIIKILIMQSPKASSYFLPLFFNRLMLKLKMLQYLENTNYLPTFQNKGSPTHRIILGSLIIWCLLQTDIP